MLREAVRLFRAVVMILVGLWLVCGRTYASVQEAADPIFNHRTQTLLEAVQAGGTDLPMSLQTPRDIYLFVTAGAAYTEVRALALPSVPPPQLAQALAASTSGTALAGRTVTWSADDYSAALLLTTHSRPLSRSSANVVPVGALVAGLRRAGFSPHTLLRVPRYASGAPLPPRRRHTIAFNWYDQRQVAGLNAVTVRATLSAVDLGMALFFVCFVGLVGTIGLLAANWVGRNERLPVETRRRYLRSLALSPMFLAIGLYAPFMVFYLRNTRSFAIADLWLGSSSTSSMVPLMVIGCAAMMIILPFSMRLERKLLGPAPGLSPVPMSPEEKAVHQRMARWNMAPHLMAGLLIGGSIFLPHNSQYRPWLHPTGYLLAGLGTLVVSQLFRKPLSAFTRIAPDDDLTWRARQLGMQMGARPQDVKVEDSSKATHFATIRTERGGHIVVSRKLVEIMTLNELEFLLAHQVALMKTPISRPMVFYPLLVLLPTVLPVAFVTWILSGHRIVAMQNWMPYLMLLMMLPTVVILLAGKRRVFWEAQRAAMADQTALAVTGDSAAAQSALMKLAQNAPALPGQATAPNAFPTGLAERLKALTTAPGVAR